MLQIRWVFFALNKPKEKHEAKKKPVTQKLV